MKQRLIEIIKKALTSQPKDDCGCGCSGNCGKPVRLNESKQYDAPISEGLRYHIDNKLTLQETIYRPGSKAHVELIHEARLLWKQGVINLYGEDKELFETTDIGKFGIYEYQVVPLDFPIMEVEKIPGGLAKGMTIKDLADHHKVDVDTIKKALAKGIKVELEHTTDKAVAKEIAMDHVYEDLKYYDKLKKIEENLKEYNVGLEPTSVCFTDKLLTINEVTLFIAIYFLLVAGEGFEPSRLKRWIMRPLRYQLLTPCNVCTDNGI